MSFWALCFAAFALECRGQRWIAGDDPRVRYEGRVVPDHEGCVRFAWPRSAVHLRFNGTRLIARLRDETPPDGDPDALGVQVDGGPLRRVVMRPGVSEYTFAEGLSRGVHTLRVLKLTEAEVGTVWVEGVAVPDGALLAIPPAPRRRMLAIGDSITAGYGARAPDATRCGTAYNDISLSWVSLAADALGAELHVVAWSGRGLIHNFNPADRATLTDLFERQIPTETDARTDLRAWVPDDVVINVGTNDALALDFDDARYARALDGFVQHLHSLYPRARFVLAVGPLLSDHFPLFGSRSLARVLAATTEVASHHRAQCSVLELSAATDAEGCGCSRHPSARTQARMAQALVAALR